MATSNIRLYYNSKLTPSKNYLLDDLNGYLSSLNYLDINNFQYQKIEIDMNIKINMNQDELVDMHYNYLKITQSSMIYYYFIISNRWISQNTIELTLSMDTIHTFKNQINNHFTDKTNIIRQHKDRFVYDARFVNPISNPDLIRQIDQVQEGISGVSKRGLIYKFYTQDDKFRSLNWYLVYNTRNTGTGTTARTWLECNLYCSESFRLDESRYITSINTVDRTQQTLVKILELPYPPLEFVKSGNNYIWDDEAWGYIPETHSLKLQDLNTQFKFTMHDGYPISPLIVEDIQTLANRKSELKNIKYESKLLHSDFYTYKYMYDSFAKEFLLEHFTNENSASRYPKLNIEFYPSTGITSDLAFKFNIENTEYSQLDNYENFLIAKRNNELPIYTSEFLNYMRTGYNYDKKNKDLTNQQRWVGSMANVVGTAAALITGFVSANPVSVAAGISMAVSTTTQLANNIYANITDEEAWAGKMRELKNQSLSIGNSDDIAMLHVYDGQCLKYGWMQPSDQIRESIWDLFHYCGYADGRQAIPTLDSRRCFNYIQCDPVFDNEQDTIWLKYVDDVKARFKAGVTVLHKFNNGTTTGYDFDQKYENFETWICDRS